MDESCAIGISSREPAVLCMHEFKLHVSYKRGRESVPEIKAQVALMLSVRSCAEHQRHAATQPVQH